MQPLQESAGNNKVQMQQPSQRTSLIHWQQQENSVTEELICQKVNNKIIRAEIEVLQQRLDTEQLQ